MPEPYNYTLNVPNPMDAFRQGMQDRIAQENLDMQRQQQEAAMMRQQQMQADTMGLMKSNDPRDFVNFAMKYPEQGANVRQGWEILDKSKKEGLAKDAMQIASALFSGNTDIAIEALNQKAIAYRNAGDEPNAKALETLASVAKTNPDVAKTMIGTQLAAVDPDALKNVAMAQRLPSDIAKASAEAETAAIEAKYAPQVMEAKVKKLIHEAEKETNDTVQSTKILPDGTTVMAMKSGKTKVISQDGNELEGSDRVQAIRNAETYGADVKGMREKQGSIGREGGKLVGENVKQINAINKNLNNIDKAIEAIDKGANSGIIAKQFPDWKASTIALKNAQQQMGLDVIGSVTFGALSEGELALALNTALPDNMQPQELRKWLLDKKEAQRKLTDYLSEQAIFLSQEGNTLANWLKKGKSGGATPSAAPAARKSSLDKFLGM